MNLVGEDHLRSLQHLAPILGIDDKIGDFTVGFQEADIERIIWGVFDWFQGADG